MDYGMPSQRQLAAAARFGINVTSEMDAQDVSDLLSRQLRQDPKEPNPGLIEFARNRGIHFANGIGKRALYNRIWEQLPQSDKFAFFSFCVYRYLSDDRNIADMDKSPHKESFYKFADRCMKYARYAECLEDYEGENLRCFGGLIINEDNEYNIKGVDIITKKLFEINKESKDKSKLTEREKEILFSYFGIGVEKMTYSEIGKKLHISTQGVQQNLKNTLKKIRFSEYITDLSALLDNCSLVKKKII